jgi:hypothetical protein
MILFGKGERTKTLGSPRSRSDINVKIDFKKMEWQNMGLIYVFLDGWLFGWLVIRSSIHPVI